MLILELFPGAGLFGRGIENKLRQLGVEINIVRGPDLLWGQDIRDFHPLKDIYDGVIGGPPCTMFSRARHGQTTGENLIPEFLRVVEEANPKFAIMENVTQAVPYAPNWPSTLIRDWDCGGHTWRRRRFWFKGLPAIKSPLKREGNPAYTVVASSWKERSQTHKALPKRSMEEAAQLQGFPDFHQKVLTALPVPSGSHGMTQRNKEILIIHMLGNGVPKAIGEYIGNHIFDHYVNADPT